MKRDASKRVLRVANECLLLSFGILILMSFIDVVPSKQSSFDHIFFSVAVAVAVSFSISCYMMIARFFHLRSFEKGRKNYEQKQDSFTSQERDGQH